MEAFGLGENYTVHFDRKIGELERNVGLFKCHVDGETRKVVLARDDHRIGGKGISAILDGHILMVRFGKSAHEFLQNHDVLECKIEDSGGTLKIVYKELKFETQYFEGS